MKCCKNQIILYDRTFSHFVGTEPQEKMIYHCLRCGKVFEVFVNTAFQYEKNNKEIEDKTRKEGIYIK